MFDTFCYKLNPKCMFWESKHKGKDFVKSTNNEIILFYVQKSIAHIRRK